MGKLEEKVDIFEEKILEEGLRSARALIQSFLQTVKAFRLYETGHPILTKFLERLKKDFEHYFDEFESFTLQVGEHRLFYQGKVVYESQDVKESLAFLFFKDGIREIQFSRGLEFREILDFLNVVRKGEYVNRMEDDLVTLLWEKDFSHISFTTVDDFLGGSGIFVPATWEDLVKGSEYKGFPDGGLGEGIFEKEIKQDLNEEGGGLRQLLNPSFGQSLAQACQLTQEEMESLRKEVEQEQEPEYLFVLINNLIEILLHLGEDVDAYENMISYFERLLHSLLEQKEIEKVVTILRNLNETMESMVLKDKQIFAIQRILDASSSPQSVELLGKAMKSNGELNQDSILQYLTFLTKKAIDPLCTLLGELESGKWRKAICDVLVELSREEIQPLTKFLKDPNSFLVCHLLYVLGRIKHPSTLKYLEGLVDHKDQKVREELLQVLNKFGDKGKDLIHKLLKDPSPEIRAKASILFARTAKRGATQPLMEIILSEDFYKRDYEEKASFFKAVAETGAEEIIPTLKKISKKRRWFQREKWNEMRLCASNALKMIEANKRPVGPPLR
ncbi:MAG: HEAT repeat domain-containing protein [Thermodesulfobacteriota bacterium]